MPNPKPAMKYKIGRITATIWLNDKFYTTVLSKSYKVEGEETWKETDQLSHSDLLNASALLQKAELWISGQ
jgi:hypothetical protein